MKSKGIFYLTCALVFLSIFSCTKEEESPSDILKNNEWFIVKWTVNPAIDIGGTLMTDITSLQPSCVRDNLISFKSDNSISRDEGVTKCAATDPQVSTDGSWDLSFDAKYIYLVNTSLTQGQGTIQARVNKLDASELNATLPNLLFNNTMVDLTISCIPK
ncbi:MAG: hypothetical protein IPH93_00315 [Saprospiraceae bacterium]|nr:hypothetical protein [Saprospiraceae bacterium]MBK7809956.1 hypothetical protein [Saprospiraceae bacterium]MBK9629560.1 hypothetical protein [Saprospiraceae bacterium]